MRRGSGSDIFARNRLKFLDTWASARDRWRMRSVSFTITGMTCGGCVAAVKVQLKRTEGVTAYDVSLEKGEAGVSYDAAKATPEKIAESVSKTGFEASVKSSSDKKEK